MLDVKSKIKLTAHQEIMVERMVANRAQAIWVDVGGMKSSATLEALMRIQPIGHILIVAPKHIARSGWIDEIEKFEVPIRYRSLIFDSNDRKLTRDERIQRIRETFTDPPTMYFINIDLVADLVDQLPRRTGPRGGLYETVWPFPTVIIDEAHTIKGHDSVVFKQLMRVRPQIERIYELTGTPMPQGFTDLWAQMALLDGGLALGKSHTEFMNRYFESTHTTATGIPIDFRLRDPEVMIPEIAQRVSHLVMNVVNHEVNRPEAVTQPIRVNLDPDTLESYRSFKREKVLELVGDEITARPVGDGNIAYQDYAPAQALASAKAIVADNAAILRGKLLQMASGTLYSDDVEDLDDLDLDSEDLDEPRRISRKGTREFIVTHMHKIDALEWYLDEFVDTPAVIAYRHKSERSLIKAELEDRGHQVHIFGGSRKEKQDWNDGKIPIMLLHPRSAGPGLNIQFGGRHVIWYALPDSSTDWTQLNGRLDRPGQLRRVIIAYLTAAATFDAQIPALIQDKVDRQLDFVARFNLDHQQGWGPAAEAMASFGTPPKNPAKSKARLVKSKTVSHALDGVEDDVARLYQDHRPQPPQ